MTKEMGARIGAGIDGLKPAVSRREFAERVGMTPDALSRAISGQRGVSSLELHHIAEALGADMHALVTGEPDPRRITVSARHDFDPETWGRKIPTFEQDAAQLESIRIAYAKAEPTSSSLTALEGTPAGVRHQLGEGFARNFIDRIESRLGIDVIRIHELGTAYTITFSGRTVIVIPARGSWFRENWDLAHELAHVAGEESEAAANAFAAEMLLPEPLMRELSWGDANMQSVADFLWETGVSSGALSNRLNALGLRTPELKQMLDCPTQRLLRQARSWSHEHGDQITKRMEAAAARRFPLLLQEAHERQIESGCLDGSYLAWMRGVNETWVEEAYAPAKSSVSVEDLAAGLGLSLA